MTDADFRAFVAQARAEVDTELARLDTLDRVSMDPDERATLQERRRGYTELRDSMTEDALAAELLATEYAGRDLTPDEVAAIRKRQ